FERLPFSSGRSHTIQKVLQSDDRTRKRQPPLRQFLFGRVLVSNRTARRLSALPACRPAASRRATARRAGKRPRGWQFSGSAACQPSAREPAEVAERTVLLAAGKSVAWDGELSPPSIMGLSG